jgi:hypothetical protein
MSAAIQRLQAPGKVPILTAMVAGAMNQNQMQGIDVPFTGGWVIHTWCPSSPLAAQFTSASFIELVGGGSDGIVPLFSATNMKDLPVDHYIAAVHSAGAEKLGFRSPSLLKKPDTFNKVVELLNTPVSDTVRFQAIVQ